MLIPTYASDYASWFGTMDEGDRISHDIYLEAGVTYAFAAVAENDDMDLDLYLYDAHDDLVAVDKSAESDAFVVYTPTRSQTFSIALRCYSGSGTYGLALVR